ncbi:MAG: hypothetical protein HHAS10_08870 [Candidatus Altimarinota bacterium]
MKNITTRAQYDALTRDRILGKSECPFCDISGQTGHTIWKGKYWYILKNLFPYSGNEDHIMAVPYEHKCFSYELNQSEILELSGIYEFVKNYYGEKDYFSCTRETFSNRSIEHFHMHFIPGKLQGKWLRKMLEGQGFPIHEDLKIEENLEGRNSSLL